MQKTYQKNDIDACAPAVPEQVSVALAELAGEVREGLLALAVGAGRIGEPGRASGAGAPAADAGHRWFR